MHTACMRKVVGRRTLWYITIQVCTIRMLSALYLGPNNTQLDSVFNSLKNTTSICDFAMWHSHKNAVRHVLHNPNNIGWL